MWATGRRAGRHNYSASPDGYRDQCAKERADDECVWCAEVREGRRYRNEIRLRVIAPLHGGGQRGAGVVSGDLNHGRCDLVMSLVVVGLCSRPRRARPLTRERRRRKRSNYEERARRYRLKNPSHAGVIIHSPTLGKAVSAAWPQEAPDLCARPAASELDAA